MSQYITDNNILVAYYQRLTKPYTTKKKPRFFIEQYLNGDGNELAKKFWAKHSSSRLAFELYSWLVNADWVVDFAFEYKLKAIASSTKKPNMDVFIETRDSVIFVESKFTEKPCQTFTDKTLSPAYYLKDSVTRRNKEYSLSDRYYGNENVAEIISQFIKGCIKELPNKTKSCWLDYPQEIKHLIGLYLFLKDNPKLKKKKVYFYNICFHEDSKDTGDVKYFFESASDLMKILIGDNFEYGHKSVQEVIDEIQNNCSNVSAFGLDRKVLDILKDKSLFNPVPLK